MSIKRLASIAFLGLAVLPHNAHADSNVQFSTGINYSSGDFGLTQKTKVAVIPFSVKLKTGNWAFRASVPYVTVDGPGDVGVVLDDHGGGRGGNSGPGRGGRPEDDGSNSGSGRSNRVSGLGDLSLSTTYSFNEIGDSDFYSDVTARVRLATGNENKGLSAGATDYGLATEFGIDKGNGGAYLSVGRRFLGSVTGVARQDGWQAGVGGWRDVGDKTSFGFGYDWSQATSPSGQNPREVYANMSYQMTDTLNLGFNASAGLNDASPDFGVGVSLTWRTQGGRRD